MKFTQPCLIMTVENNEIDWALFVEPQEEYTRDDVIAQCDRNVDSLYVYPMQLKTINTVAETMDYINSALTEHKPQDVPGMFTL